MSLQQPKLLEESGLSATTDSVRACAQPVRGGGKGAYKRDSMVETRNSDSAWKYATYDIKTASRNKVRGGGVGGVTPGSQSNITTSTKGKKKTEQPHSQRVSLSTSSAKLPK